MSAVLSTVSNEQWIRKANLLVIAGTQGLDLSETHFRFQVRATDERSPNNASIRVYNLADPTAKLVQKEFNRIVIQAGYESSFGVIFDGTIKQFRRGRESNVNSYLDILAADGDIGTNFGVCKANIAAGSSTRDRIAVAVSAMGLPLANANQIPTGGILPRGKVLWGMGRDHLRCQTDSIGATWSVQDGQVQILPLKGYLPGDALELNSATGMIGLPEATQDGISIRCLLNPKLRIGGLVRINNRDINQTFQKNPQAPVPFNQWTGFQFIASVTEDGLYRLYVVEHTGDTRGQEWYSDLICLAVEANTVKAS